jgi:hypothetical protein
MLYSHTAIFGDLGVVLSLLALLVAGSIIFVDID